jgi:hypothetical protein
LSTFGFRIGSTTFQFYNILSVTDRNTFLIRDSTFIELCGYIWYHGHSGVIVILPVERTVIRILVKKEGTLVFLRGDILGGFGGLIEGSVSVIEECGRMIVS